MSYSVGDVLHTKSSFANDISTPQPNRLNDKLSYLKNQVDRAAAREQNFYAKFGAKDFFEFKVKLQTLLGDTNLEVIRRFSYENIKGIIESFKAYTIKDLDFGQQTEFIIDLDKTKFKNDLQGLETILKQRLGGKNVTITNVEGSITKIDVSLKDASSVVQFYNSLYGKRKRTSKNKKTGEKELSKNFLKDFKKKEFLGSIIEITQNGEHFDRITFTNLDDLTIDDRVNFPWGLTGSQLEKYIKENPNNEKIQNILQKIKEGIESRLNQLVNGASNEMIRAYKETLNEKVPQLVDGKIENFFLKGDNLVNGLLGAFGEFQNALLLNYLSIVLPNLPNSSAAQITGNISGNGYQPRRDVTFLFQFGIQSKMLDPGSLNNTDINVYITVSEITEKGLMTQSFDSFMANTIFNEDILAGRSDYDTVMKEVKEILMEYEAHRANLSAGLSENVDFYWISGKYLVPASKILEGFLSSTTRFNSMKGEGSDIKFVAGYSGKSDDYFKKDKNYERYWVWDKGWQFTSNNTKEFAKIINRAHFSSNLNLGNIDYGLYALF